MLDRRTIETNATVEHFKLSYAYTDDIRQLLVNFCHQNKIKAVVKQVQKFTPDKTGDDNYFEVIVKDSCIGYIDYYAKNPFKELITLVFNNMKKV